MSHEASGRFALIVATGILALWGTLQAAPVVAAPQQDAAQESAAPTAKTTPVAKKKATRLHAKQVKKKPAPAKPAKPTAENTGDDVKAKDQSKLAAKPMPEATPQDEAQAAAEPSPALSSSSLPPSIANANAQFPDVAAADGATPAAAVSPGSDSAAKPAADIPVMAPDEVNELDRAAAEAAAPAVMAANTATVTGSAPPSTVGTAQVASATGNDGAWDKASLIGKIFIAAGGLLTLASAARMFMA